MCWRGAEANGLDECAFRLEMQRMPINVVGSTECKPSRSSSSAATKMVELFPEFAKYLQDDESTSAHHGNKRKRCWLPLSHQQN